MPARPGLTVERVVDAAATIADRDGYGALTLGAVAAALEVRTPSLYNHVEGLDDLRRRLTVRALEELGRRLERATVGLAGEDAVAALVTAFRDFARDHPGLYASTVPTSERDDPEVRRAGAAAMTTVVSALRGFDLEGDEAIHAARALRSAVHGFVTLELAGGFGLSVDLTTSFAWLTDLLTTGIRARSPSPGVVSRAHR